jgi:hypothetical protein
MPNFSANGLTVEIDLLDPDLVFEAGAELQLPGNLSC